MPPVKCASQKVASVLVIRLARTLTATDFVALNNKPPFYVLSGRGYCSLISSSCNP